MGDVDKIIAAINPKEYLAWNTKKELNDFYKILKYEGFSAAVKKAKPKATREHKIVYDSPSESLEPLYFWTLDLMDSLFRSVEKPIDNFTSSPGSGHFAEMGARATRMQEEAMKILGQVNTVIKSIINLIYDLKQWETLLTDYKMAKSNDKKKAQTALLALKQRWLDNVDIKRGRGAIHAMAQDLSFITLRDAFMIADTPEDVDKKDLDLNDRVKRILKPRVAEFLEWKKRSEAELFKRYEIERSYLKSQVNSLKLYSRWARPYLHAAEKLRMDSSSSPELVNAFNIILFELALLGKTEVDVNQAVIDKALPESLSKAKIKRKYYSCVLVNFHFRGIPQRVGQQQHYSFGGRSTIEFKGYALNEDELLMLKHKLSKEDISEALKLVEGVTTESLSQIEKDIEYFLKSDEERQAEIKEEKSSEDINPFMALFGLGKKKSKPEKKKEKEEKDTEKVKVEKLEEKGIPKDSYTESLIRKHAAAESQELCYNLFDIYKKAHGMPSLGPLTDTKSG